MNSVAYVLNLNDFDALNANLEKEQFGRVRGIINWGIPIFFSLLAVLQLLLLWSSSGQVQGNNPRVAYGTVVVFLVVGFGYRITKATARRKFRSTPHFGSSASLELQEKGALACGPNGETLLYWKAIRRVEETEAHVFFYINAKSAFIAPKRDFPSPADAQHFVALAQRLWQESRPVVPPLASPQ